MLGVSKSLPLATASRRRLEKQQRHTGQPIAVFDGSRVRSRWITRWITGAGKSI
jgi:hypothetical protein